MTRQAVPLGKHMGSHGNQLGMRWVRNKAAFASSAIGAIGFEYSDQDACPPVLVTGKTLSLARAIKNST